MKQSPNPEASYVKGKASVEGVWVPVRLENVMFDPASAFSIQGLGVGSFESLVQGSGVRGLGVRGSELRNPRV